MASVGGRRRDGDAIPRGGGNPAVWDGRRGAASSGRGEERCREVSDHGMGGERARAERESSGSGLGLDFLLNLCEFCTGIAADFY